MTYPRALPCGDSGVSIEFGDHIDPLINQSVLALDQALSTLCHPGIVEQVPTYRALMVHYDPLLATFDEIKELALAIARDASLHAEAERMITLPICYDGEFGADLPALSDRLNLDQSVIIDRHLNAEYRVYMLGFQPGFAYLGGLDPALSLPRHNKPRWGAPAGTISIAAGQCAVHSVEGPSGWHWIGRTPVQTFRDGDTPIFELQPGDRIRFRKICGREWHRLREEAVLSAGPTQEAV